MSVLTKIIANLIQCEHFDEDILKRDGHGHAFPIYARFSLSFALSFWVQTYSESIFF